MKLIDEIKDTLLAANKKRAAKTEEVISALRTVEGQMNERTNRLVTLLAPLQAALDKQGLRLEDAQCCKTGLPGAWSDGDKLRVSARAVSTGKFKFLTFRGYTASGKGYNERQLNAKAANLSHALRDGTGLSDVQVNACSLEIREGTPESNTVLIEFWV